MRGATVIGGVALALFSAWELLFPIRRRACRGSCPRRHRPGRDPRAAEFPLGQPPDDVGDTDPRFRPAARSASTLESPCGRLSPRWIVTAQAGLATPWCRLPPPPAAWFGSEGA